jgi:ADP-heptose:LPS heptosyltransferase
VLLTPLRNLGITDTDPVPRLRLAGRTAPRPGGSVPRWLAVHPGSGSERKNWPEARWAALLERLAAETKLGLLLVGGEAEGGRVERLAQSWPAARCRTAVRRPLIKLAALLRECCAFAGHDSGITHLAAAVGLPVLVLWGETAETVWRPRGERIRLLRGGRGLVSLAVSEVRGALSDLLAGDENAQFFKLPRR